MNPDYLERKIDDAPFAWLAKAALWRIRDAFDESTFLDQSLAVYWILAELASDAQSATFIASRRRIAERSGVSVRRVAEILARFKSLKLLAWKQNHLVGTKELAPSTYTLTSCTPSTTLGTPSIRLGGERKTENCTVVEESPNKNLFKKSHKGDSNPLSIYKPWQLRKDLRETNSQAERDAINAELARRKGKPIKPAPTKPRPKPPAIVTPTQTPEQMRADWLAAINQPATLSDQTNAISAHPDALAGRPDADRVAKTLKQFLTTTTLART